MPAKKTSPQRTGKAIANLREGTGKSHGNAREGAGKRPGSTREGSANPSGSVRESVWKAPGSPRQGTGKPPASDAEGTRNLRDEDATIAWLRQMMTDFVRERSWEKYHIPRNLAASVAVEAGELLELFQWLTPEEAEKRAKNDPAFRKAVGEEMCDVIMYCISLANAMDFDVAATIAAKMVKNRAKYPPEKFRGHYERPIGQ